MLAWIAFHVLLCHCEYDEFYSSDIIRLGQRVSVNRDKQLSTSKTLDGHDKKNIRPRKELSIRHVR